VPISFSNLLLLSASVNFTEVVHADVQQGVSGIHYRMIIEPNHRAG
jgi:hypothetical protein